MREKIYRYISGRPMIPAENVQHYFRLEETIQVEKKYCSGTFQRQLIDVSKAQKVMLERTKIPLAVLAWLFEIKMKKSPLTKSMMCLAMWNSGFADQYSAKEMIQAVLSENPDKWCLRDNLHKITCPTLALAGINEGKELIDQARDFYQAISSNKKDLYIFTMENDGSDDHCQLDNRTSANRVIFDWLDELFKEGTHA